MGVKLGFRLLATSCRSIEGWMEVEMALELEMEVGVQVDMV